MKHSKPEDLFRAEKERALSVRNSQHARLLAEAKAAFDKLMAEGQAARKSGRPRKHPLPPLKTASSRTPARPVPVVRPTPAQPTPVVQASAPAKPAIAAAKPPSAPAKPVKPAKAKSSAPKTKSGAAKPKRKAKTSKKR